MITQGHRGCRAEFPENSIEGVKRAIALGAFAVEVDIQLTQDQELVVVHDSELFEGYYRLPAERQSLRVWESTLSTLTQVEFGHEPLAKFPEQEVAVCHIPSLQDLIDASAGHRLNLELKVPFEKNEDQSWLRGYAEVISGLLAKQNYHPWRIKSFNLSLLEKLAKIDHSYPLHYLIEAPLNIDSWTNFADFVRPNPEFRGLSVRHDLIDQRMVERCLALQIHLSAWTVNDLATAERLKALGVIDLVSDDPGLLLNQQEKHG
ncbi:MAG: hypothetical protein MK081_08745 [Flavobacteriales bacterium]|nr:hypothetical protein [Flavobacteriales bacterium]